MQGTGDSKADKNKTEKQRGHRRQTICIIAYSDFRESDFSVQESFPSIYLTQAI